MDANWDEYMNEWQEWLSEEEQTSEDFLKYGSSKSANCVDGRQLKLTNEENEKLGLLFVQGCFSVSHVASSGGW